MSPFGLRRWTQPAGQPPIAMSSIGFLKMGIGLASSQEVTATT